MKNTHLTPITLTLTLLFALITPQISTATLLDFEDLPDAHLFSGGDQNIGTFYAGLTFGPDVMGLVSGIDLDPFAYPPHSGNNVIFTDDPSGEIEVIFGTPVLDVSAFYTSLTDFTLEAYDALGALIGSVSEIANTDGAFFGTSDPISISAADIKSVKFIGSPNFYIVDDLSFTPASGVPIPEPSSLLLVALGLLGVSGMVMRHRRKAGRASS